MAATRYHTGATSHGICIRRRIATGRSVVTRYHHVSPRAVAHRDFGYDCLPSAFDTIRELNTGGITTFNDACKSQSTLDWWNRTVSQCLTVLPTLPRAFHGAK
jgi:hypothetical protein